MRSPRFMPLLAAALLALFEATWLWQTPGAVRGKLTPAEIDRYVAAVDAAMPMDAAERARVVARVRAFAESDDGRPFYMLNLMRYYDRVRALPGVAPFAGTPRGANEYYEEHVVPILLGKGGFPAVAGTIAGHDLFGHELGAANYDRVLMVRYPSRRAFLDLVTDPAYLPYVPYKLMAQDVVLVPVTGELALPDLRLVVGIACVLAFAAAGWWRSARRPIPPVGGGA